MYRRAITVLLLPCVLLTQSVAPVHSHGGDQPADHDSRPHFHTSALRGGHTHHHDGHGHHHHDEDDAEEAAEVPAPSREPLSDHHDADAVFVGPVDAACRERPQAEASEPATPLIAQPDRLVADWDAPTPREVEYWNHPPPTAGACPLFVRHLTLLI